MSYIGSGSRVWTVLTISGSMAKILGIVKVVGTLLSLIYIK